MRTHQVIRAATLGAMVAAVALPASLAAQRRGGGGGHGGGQRQGPPPATGTTRAGAAQGSGGGIVGVRVGQRAGRQGSVWLNPAPGFSGTLGQGIGANLGQGLVIPPGGYRRGTRHPGGRGGSYAGGRWRQRDRFSPYAVVLPYAYPSVYVAPAYGMDGGAYLPDELVVPEPVYHAPAGFLRKPPASFAPSATEGYPMGRYPIVIRRAPQPSDTATAARRPADSSAAVLAASASAPSARAALGFMVEEITDSMVRLRWPDDGRGVREVTLFIAGTNGQVIATQIVRAAPYTALFDVRSRRFTAGVTVVRPDGTKATTTVPWTR